MTKKKNVCKKRGSCRVDINATDEGYPIYKKVGFTDKDTRYTEMRYKTLSKVVYTQTDGEV